jgi:hypothetical protein
LARVYQKLKRMEDFRRELRIFQSQKLEQQESLIRATGARGDPTRKLDLMPGREAR